MNIIDKKKELKELKEELKGKKRELKEEIKELKKKMIDKDIKYTSEGLGSIWKYIQKV